MQHFKTSPKIQGQNSIIINSPASEIWPLIVDSKALEIWGPPVEKVEVRLLPGQTTEDKGSERKVYAKFSEKRSGWFEEVRTNQVPGKSISFLITNDNFDIDKMLTDVGGKMEVLEINEQTSKFIFTFYHRPKNFLGWVMNPLIKKDQKKNRLKALKSLKSYVEKGKAIKN